MPKCSFCNKEIAEHRGKMFVQNDGKVRWYCSSKCEKNVKMKRLPRTTRWVKE